MCLGESTSDTLQPVELSFLQRSTAERLPDYAVTARSNGQIAWAVLEPDDHATLPRFTICRIDPCIIVMVEDDSDRRFVSVASLEDAVVVARDARCETAARRNLHSAPKMAQ